MVSVGKFRHGTDGYNHFPIPSGGENSGERATINGSCHGMELRYRSSSHGESGHGLTRREASSN